MNTDYADTVAKMKEIAAHSEGDREKAHIEADDLLCKYLRSTGRNALVNAYERVAKWYG